MRINGFQTSVALWMGRCFGYTIATDKQERNYRFIEEANELIQALGCTREDAHKLVDYVFNRPVGAPNQEVGGVMVTLAALCTANDLSLEGAATDELTRILQPEVMEKIRRKQATKPQRSPLPGLSVEVEGFAAPEMSAERCNCGTACKPVVAPYQKPLLVNGKDIVTKLRNPWGLSLVELDQNRLHAADYIEGLEAVIHGKPISDDEALVMEAFDFGQFAPDMLGNALAKPLQKALRNVLTEMYSRLYGPMGRRDVGASPNLAAPYGVSPALDFHDSAAAVFTARIDTDGYVSGIGLQLNGAASDFDKKKEV